MPKPTPRKNRWLAALERLIPLLLSLAVPVGGAIWAVYVFTANQADVATKQAAERTAQTTNRLIELQKPFIDQQFDTYNQFAKAIGDILVVDLGNKEAFQNALDRYWLLHWSGVALVEDQEVHSAKLDFADKLASYSSVIKQAHEMFEQRSSEIARIESKNAPAASSSHAQYSNYSLPDMSFFRDLPAEEQQKMKEQQRSEYEQRQSELVRVNEEYTKRQSELKKRTG
jgi:hypothetical protein